MNKQFDDIPQTVRDLLRQERETKALTIREHAEQMGISMPTYFRIQRGKIDKTAVALVRLALKNTTPDSLLAA